VLIRVNAGLGHSGRWLTVRKAEPAYFNSVSAITRHLDSHHQAIPSPLFGVVIGRVMRYVTVNQPCSRFERRPDGTVPLARADIQRIGLEPGGALERLTIARQPQPMDRRGYALDEAGGAQSKNAASTVIPAPFDKWAVKRRDVPPGSNHRLGGIGLEV
jgi:hypothetical protein